VCVCVCVCIMADFTAWSNVSVVMHIVVTHSLQAYWFYIGEAEIDFLYNFVCVLFLHSL